MKLAPRLGFIAGFTFVALAGPGMITSYVDSNVAPAVPASDGPTYVEQLISDNQCWQGEAPGQYANTIPGHVVFERADSVSARLGGDQAVSLAFEQLFDRVDHGLTIYAFCP